MFEVGKRYKANGTTERVITVTRRTKCYVTYTLDGEQHKRKIYNGFLGRGESIWIPIGGGFYVPCFADRIA